MMITIHQHDIVRERKRKEAGRERRSGKREIAGEVMREGERRREGIAALHPSYTLSRIKGKLQCSHTQNLNGGGEGKESLPKILAFQNMEEVSYYITNFEGPCLKLMFLFIFVSSIIS